MQGEQGKDEDGGVIRSEEQTEFRTVRMGHVQTDISGYMEA